MDNYMMQMDSAQKGEMEFAQVDALASEEMTAVAEFLAQADI